MAAVSAWVIAAGCVLAVLAGVPYTAFDLDRHAVPKELVLHVVAGLALLLAPRRAGPLRLGREDACLLAVLLLGAASGLAAENRWAAGRALAIGASGTILFLRARALAAAGQREVCFAGLALAVVVGATTALLQAYGVEFRLLSEARAPGGTFGNRNFMAHVMVLGLPIVLLAAVRGDTRFVRGTAWVAAAACMVALVLSRSRGAWLGAGVAAGVAWVAARALPPAADGRRARPGPFVATALAAVVLALTLPNALQWKSRSPYAESLGGIANYREGSGRGRLLQYRNTLGMVRDHPVLGVGPGNWPGHYPAYARPGDPSLDIPALVSTNPWPSSDWVAYLAERGAPALLAFAAAALVLAARAVQALGRPDGGTAVCALAMLAAVATMGTFDAHLLLPVPTMLFAVAMGALLPEGPPLRVLGEGWRSLGRLAGLLVAGGAAAYAALGIVTMGLHDGGALADRLRAARLNPGSFRLQAEAAQQLANRGQCARARPFIAQAATLQRRAPAVARLRRRCGG